MNCKVGQIWIVIKPIRTIPIGSVATVLSIENNITHVRLKYSNDVISEHLTVSRYGNELLLMSENGISELECLIYNIDLPQDNGILNKGSKWKLISTINSIKSLILKLTKKRRPLPPQ